MNLSFIGIKNQSETKIVPTQIPKFGRAANYYFFHLDIFSGHTLIAVFFRLIVLIKIPERRVWMIIIFQLYNLDIFFE